MGGRAARAGLSQAEERVREPRLGSRRRPGRRPGRRTVSHVPPPPHSRRHHGAGRGWVRSHSSRSTELPPLAGARHARGVRVAAAAGVAFGGDQHVLAERGQVMAADRAAVRRGLAVRRAAHRPPRGRWKARWAPPHCGPSGRGALATALAVVGVGVGVALAKAQRERRSERAPARPAPREERRRHHRCCPASPSPRGCGR